jgi:hypothetical protein
MTDTAPLPPEEPKLEKPARNWRGYLKEYAVIVVGVLTALAAQQAADWLRWESEVKAARAAIHAEMTFNNTAFFVQRAALAPCLEKQIAEAERIMDDLEARRPPSRFTVFQSGSGATLRQSEWLSERAAQTLTHFPRAELAMMGSYYAQLENFTNWMRYEAEGWRALSVLRNPPEGMAVSDLLRLRAALEDVKNANWLTVLNAGRQLRISRQLGITATPVNQERIEKFCTSNVEDYRIYLNSLEPRP